MKKFLIILLLVPTFLYCQFDDPIFNFENKENDKNELLPNKMLLTQRIFWGEKGVFRKINISKLNKKNRQKELVVRKKMLKAHQFIGYLTFLGMLTQGYLGGKLYSGDYSLYDLHKNIGKAVTISYFTGAGLSLFSPPPLVRNKKKGFSSIKAHKILGGIHFSAMIATNIYSDKNKSVHKASAYTAFVSYALAIVVFKF